MGTGIGVPAPYPPHAHSYKRIQHSKVYDRQFFSHQILFKGLKRTQLPSNSATFEVRDVPRSLQQDKVLHIEVVFV